jgi:hypothetical protein
MKRSLWLVALAPAFELMVGAAVAAPLDSANFTYKYEGDQYNPITGYNENNNVWGTTPSLQTSVPGSTDGNVLSFAGDINSGGGFFSSTQWPGHPINNATGWTVEFRIRIGTDASDGQEGAFGLTTNDASTDAGQAFVVGQSNFGFYQNAVSPESGDFDTNDNTDGFHVFRLAQNSNSGTTDAWRDGVSVGSLSGFAYNFATPEMYWADGSGNIGGPTVQVDYVRFEPGYFEPVPEPSAAVLLAIGAVTLFRRKRA